MESLLIVDAATGSRTDRQMTAQESEALAEVVAESDRINAERQAAKDAAVAKLTALGLTVDDLTALGL